MGDAKTSFQPMDFQGALKPGEVANAPPTNSLDEAQPSCGRFDRFYTTIAGNPERHLYPFIACSWNPVLGRSRRAADPKNSSISHASMHT